MSTRGTIYHDAETQLHIFDEAFDDENVYVETPHIQPVAIPFAAFHRLSETLQHRVVHVQTTAAMSDKLIRSRVEREVDERTAAREARGGKSSILDIAGGLAYGDAGDPREKQIEHGIEYWQEERARCRRLLGQDEQDESEVGNE